MVRFLQVSAIIIFLVFIQKVSFSQTENEQDKGSTIKVFNNLKISGYIQADFQVADSVGANMHFAGGSFSSRFTDKRFAVRRGRLQFSHETTMAKAQVSFDFTERGAALKDAYIKVSEPYLNALHVKAGVFYRPFGYELSYSSSLRETPERSRVVQTLFPLERDLGASISFGMPDTSILHFLSLEAGFFNGNAVNSETDKIKDVIGRIRIANPVKVDKLHYAVAFSYYDGGINHIFEPIDTSSSNQQDKYNIYKMTTLSNGQKGFLVDSAATLASGTMGSKVDRKYMGIDAQLSFEFPFGKTELRGEYIWGVQPAAFSSRIIDNVAMYQSMNTFSPTGPELGVSFSVYNTPSASFPYMIGRRFRHHHTFVRNFDGGSFCLVQHIFDSKHRFVFKYDWYNPNKEVKGKDIDLFMRDENGEAIIDFNGSEILTFLSPADISYKTYGLGWIFDYTENVRFTLYYDMVMNEVTNVVPFVGDIKQGKNPSTGFMKDVKDNVLTVRLQYKF